MRPLSVLPLSIALLATIAACSEDPTPAASASPETPTSGEQLIAQPPAGWIQTGATHLAGIRTAQFIPDEESGNQSGEDWTRRITFESLSERPLPDPIEFIDLLSQDQDRICGTFESFPTFAGEENGYPTSVSLLVCHRHRDTDRSEITLIKTIQGNEFFYVITRAQRGPPIESPESAATTDLQPGTEPAETSLPIETEVIGGWSVYLKTITVCDADRAAQHPCPELI